MKPYVNVIVTAVFVAVAAVGVALLSSMLDNVLMPCGSGSYDGEACVCKEPYAGVHCEIINCGYGSIVSSIWMVDTITTRASEDAVSGCVCNNQWWGVNCDQCTSFNREECIGTCDPHFYGPRCEVLCMGDEKGLHEDIVAHEDARGEANWFKPGRGRTRGLCTSEGKVACLRDDDDLYFTGDHCEYKCPDCKNGGVCKYNDDGAYCDCADGFAGEKCQKECPLRCSGLNGICNIVNDEAVCTCALGRTGTGCEHACCVRGARTSRGVKMGDCKAGGGCDCDAGFYGPECDCSNATCNNNGACNDLGTCECTSHFNGTRCEYCSDDWVGPLCQIFREDCNFHGEFSVINEHGDYGCVCDPGFSGEDCELCADNAYPKPDGSNQDFMCTSIVPASMCHNGYVFSDYDAIRHPEMTMCNCTGNFTANTDCATCKDNYYGPRCDVYCATRCFQTQGTCMNSVPGCFCPGTLDLDVATQSCVNCAGGDCENGGVCYNGICQCDPGFFGDRCEVSAPVHDGKVCNGEFGSSRLTTYDAPCITKDDCVDTSHPNILNKKMALQVERYKWEEGMVCYRTDTPQALRTRSGCCVDRDADGRCDKANLTLPRRDCEDVPVMGEYVLDICDNRVLEGEVNVFEWCLGKKRGCTKNGECADPELCGDYEPGLTSAEWEARWIVDHTRSMTSLMSEVWRFPVGIEDPYPYRKWYNGTDLAGVCAVPGMYETCRDFLIPDVDVFTFNPEQKRLFRDGWQPMPEFGDCNVIAFKEYNLTQSPSFNESLGPYHVDRIHVTGFASVYAVDESGFIVAGNPEGRISGLVVLGKGMVTVTLYNYTDDECERLQKRAGRHFADCENIDIVELDYNWGPFCQWQTEGEGGFDERKYLQSTTCDGCEDYQEGCEGLPLEEKPMPDPCDVGAEEWEQFCEVYLGDDLVDGTCARMDCDCMDGPLGIGGNACQFNCPVPRGYTSPCGEGEDPPLGRCVGEAGFSLGTSRGTCECFNPLANPSEGCVVTCDEDTFACSREVDTPFTFRSMGCNYENVQSTTILPGAVASTTQGLKPFTDVHYGNCSITFESYGEACFTDGVDVFLGNHVAEDMECSVLLPDSVCNVLYGRCECATPYSVLSPTGMKYFNPEGSYRAALMQGYDINEYMPFMTYSPPADTNMVFEGKKYCPDDNEYRFEGDTCYECFDQPTCYHTATGTDIYGDTCAEYNDGENCGDYDTITSFKHIASGTCESNGLQTLNREQCSFSSSDYRKVSSGTLITNYVQVTSGTCASNGYDYIKTQDECERAAAEVLSHRPRYYERTLSSASYPTGCLANLEITRVSGGWDTYRLRVNTWDNTYASSICSSELKCLCKSTYYETSVSDWSYTGTKSRGFTKGCIYDSEDTTFYEYNDTTVVDYTVAPACDMYVENEIYERKGAYCNVQNFTVIPKNDVEACAIGCMALDAKTFHFGDSCICTMEAYEDCSKSVSDNYVGYSLLFARVTSESCEHHGLTTIQDTGTCSKAVAAFGGFSSGTTVTGCNMGGFSTFSAGKCTECVCINKRPPSKFDDCTVTVTSATCEYHGYYSITAPFECAELLGTVTTSDSVPYGCSRINGAAFVGSSRDTPCTECICSTRMCSGEPDPKYVVSNGCVSNGYYPITDPDTCAEAKRLGKPCAYELGVVPGTAPYLYTEFGCDYWLTSVDECLAAGAAFGLGDIQQISEGPPCHFKHGALYFNPTPTNFTGFNLCGLTPLPVDIEQVCAYDPPKDFVIVESENCAFHEYGDFRQEDGIDHCKRAAAQLGLVYGGEVDTDSAPAGCVRLVSDKFVWNAFQSTMKCDSSFKCVCYRKYNTQLRVGGCGASRFDCSTGADFEVTSNPLIAAGCTSDMELKNVKWNMVEQSIFRVPLHKLSQGLEVKAVSIHEDKIAYAADNIYVWELSYKSASATLLHNLTYNANDIAWSPDGSLLLFGGTAVYVWSPTDGLMHALSHTDTVLSVEWRPDGTMFASSSADKTIKLWDTESGTLLHTIVQEAEAVDIAWRPDGLVLASTMGTKINFWDTNLVYTTHPYECVSNDIPNNDVCDHAKKNAWFNSFD